MKEFKLRSLGDFYHRNDDFIQRVRIYSSHVLGDTWNRISIASHVNDLQAAISNDAWVKSNIKKEYIPLITLLRLGILNFEETQDVAMKDQRPYRIIADYYSQVKNAIDQGLTSLNTESFRGSKSLSLLFFGTPEIDNVDFIYFDNIFNLQRFLLFITSYYINPVYKGAIASLFFEYINKVPREQRHLFIRHFITLFQGTSDFSVLLLLYFKGIYKKELLALLDKLQVNPDIIRGSTLHYIIYHPDEYLYLLKQQSINVTDYVDTPDFSFPDAMNVTINGKGHYSDYYIIDAIGGYLPFSTRTEVINAYELMSQGRKMFYEPKPNTFTGVSTITYEDITPKTIVFVHGNLVDKIPYTLDELYLSTNSIALNIGQRLDYYDYKTLLNTLIIKVNQYHGLLVTDINAIVKDNSAAKLHYLIAKVKKIKDIIASPLNTLFSYIEGHESEAIELFTDMVTLGLYFRRWKGPGNPYPYKATDAMDLRVNPEELSAELITKYVGIINQPNNIITQMLTVTPRYNSLIGDAVSHSIMAFFVSVIKGESCIRVASNSFIFTGIRVLYALDQTYIDGDNVLDPDKLENINLVAPEEITRYATTV